MEVNEITRSIPYTPINLEVAKENVAGFKANFGGTNMGKPLEMALTG